MAGARQTSFYKSTEWKRCSADYIKSVGGLCEECLKNNRYTPAEIVHHKIHLNERNIDDPNITLKWDNLEAVCRQCHGELHSKSNGKKRYNLDTMGRIVYTI